MATVPGPMVEAVSTVHMRASLSAGGTVTFIPPELQAAREDENLLSYLHIGRTPAAIDLSAFDKFLRTVPRIGTTVCLCLNNSLPHRAHTHILTCTVTVTAGTQEELGCLTLPFFRHRLRKPEPPLALPGLSTTFHSTCSTVLACSTASTLTVRPPPQSRPLRPVARCLRDGKAAPWHGRGACRSETGAWRAPPA